MNTDVVYLSNKFEGAWRDGLIGKVFVTQEWRLEFEFPKTHIKKLTRHYVCNLSSGKWREKWIDLWSQLADQLANQWSWSFRERPYLSNEIE